MHAVQIRRPRVLAAIAAVLAIAAAMLAGGAMPAAAGTVAFDNFADAGTITGDTGTITASTVGATGETGEPTSPCPDQNGPGTLNSVWFKWTAPTTTRIQFDTEGSDYDAYLSAYVGSRLTSVTERACNDNAPGLADDAALFFNVAAGNTYRIRVDGFGANTGTAVLNWKPVPTIRPGGVGAIEGDVGTKVLNVPITLSAPTNVTVSVDWTTYAGPTDPGWATAGVDYLEASGTVTFLPGETHKTVPVTVVADLDDEYALAFGGEWGLVILSDASAKYGRVDLSFFGLGIFVIINDDGGF